MANDLVLRCRGHVPRKEKVDHGQEGRNNAAKLLRACGGCLGARRR